MVHAMKKALIRTFYAVLAIAVVLVANIFLRPITFSPTVDLDDTLPSVTLDGYTFHAQIMGDPEDPVVIAVHGGPGGDHRNLLPIAPLADDHHLVFYDQRMTGLSSRDWDGTLDLEIFFTDLDLFVDHYGNGTPVTLLGHSWGAMLASGYASRYPDKIDKIILIEAGLMRPDLAQPYFDAQSGPGWSVYPQLAWIWYNSLRVDVSEDPLAREDYLFSTAYEVMPGDGVHCGGSVPDNFEGWRASMQTVNETIMTYAMDPVLLQELDFISDAMNFAGKTLIIGSTCNTVYGAEYQERHLPFYQDARLEVIEDSGHFIFFDQPEASLEVIRAFLAE